MSHSTENVANFAARVSTKAIVASMWLLWAGLSTPAMAQQTSSGDGQSWHFRYDLFQMLLEERGLTILPSLESGLATPESSVIVIAGSISNELTPYDWRELVQFVRKGGSLLVATDETAVGQGFGRFYEGPVTTTNASYQYAGFEDCLLVSVTEGRRDLKEFRPAAQIATNRSGWFMPEAVSWLTWDVVYSLPQDCRPAASRGKAIMAVGKIVGEDSGVAIAAADASLFSNGMLWHADNAVNAIVVSELLCTGNKRNVVFIANRQVLGTYRDRPELTADNGETPPPTDRELPEPELEKALRLSNAIAKEIAESNVLNEALSQRPRNFAANRYFNALLFLIALGFLAYVARLLITRPPTRTAVLGPRQMQAAYEIGSRASGHSADFRNAAGYLAREFCFELTGSARSADWQNYLVENMPDRSRTPAEDKSLARIIDIACRGCHSAFSRSDFHALGQTIQKLRESHAELKTRLGVDAKNQPAASDGVARA